MWKGLHYRRLLWLYTRFAPDEGRQGKCIAALLRRDRTRNSLNWNDLPRNALPLSCELQLQHPSVICSRIPFQVASSKKVHAMSKWCRNADYWRRERRRKWNNNNNNDFVKKSRHYYTAINHLFFHISLSFYPTPISIPKMVIMMMPSRKNRAERKYYKFPLHALRETESKARDGIRMRNSSYLFCKFILHPRLQTPSRRSGSLKSFFFPCMNPFAFHVRF